MEQSLGQASGLRQKAQWSLPRRRDLAAQWAELANINPAVFSEEIFNDFRTLSDMKAALKGDLLTEANIGVMLPLLPRGPWAPGNRGSWS